MSFKKKIAMSLATMSLAASLVGGATFAWFTDTATNANNTFTAGTLNVEAGDQQYAIDAPVGNIAPGTTINGSFVVSNAGSLALKFQVADNAVGALFDGLTPATVTIAPIADNELAPGETATVSYSVALPTSAGNGYQAATGDLNFTVDATQLENPGWTE